MNAVAVAMLVLEFATGVVATQAGDVGGRYVTGGAVGLMALTIAFLVVRTRRRPSLADELDRFVEEWEAASPSGDSRARRQHELDMLECFRDRLAPRVREEAGRLRRAALLGRRAARAWDNPKSLREIKAIAERLKRLKSHRDF